MVDIEIPELQFNIREWEPVDFRSFELMGKKLKPLANGGGANSDAFKDACRRLLRLSIEVGQQGVVQGIHKPMDARAAAFLLANSNDFVKKVEVTSSLLDAIEAVRPVVGRQTLLLLSNTFFSHFDHLKGDKTALCEFLKRHFSRFSTSSERSDFTLLSRNRKVLFDSSGPVQVVNWAQDQECDLDLAFSKLGLNLYGQGRYADLCRYRYYLETLKSMPVGEDADLLVELSKRVVFEAPAKEGQLLGHDIVAIMIDRSIKAGELSDAWQRVILTIAGDPRVPRSSSKFQRWWALLGEDRIAQVRGWLSKFDLNLFLKVLEDYGHSAGEASLQRMFPARKKFLEGLIEQGLVSQSRLFINKHAEHYLKTHYEKDELPEYARVKDSLRRSMIYLQVGDLHMIEGSHNVTLWIFPRLPEWASVLDYGTTDFLPSELGTHIQLHYHKEFGERATPPASIRHAPQNYSWQHQAIKYLQGRGVKLQLDKLFIPSDYKQYKRHYGVQI